VTQRCTDRKAFDGCGNAAGRIKLEVLNAAGSPADVQLVVDCACQTMTVVDAITGEIRRAMVFAAAWCQPHDHIHVCVTAQKKAAG